MGPFKAGQVVKLDFLKSDKPDSYGYQYKARTPLIVVYSMSELGKAYVLEVHKAVLTNP